MTNTNDDGRVSMIHERPVPEGRFLAMLRALADVQSHSADARSVAYGQRSSGGLRGARSLRAPTTQDSARPTTMTTNRGDDR